MARILFRLLGESTTTTPSSVAATSTASLNSDLVVILAALICALICVLGLIAVSRCVWLRRLAAGTRTSSGSHDGSGQSPPPHQVAAANKGLKKKVLQSLPKITFSPESEKFAECAICLTEFAAGDELRVLPQCGHGFHLSCIDTWLGSHSSCPSCRQILVVARCHKCGGLPGSTSSGSEPEPEPEPEIVIRIKQGEDDPSSYLP